MVDILGELPDEVGEIILGYLQAEDLFACFNVCKRWKCLVNNEHLWARALPLAAYYPLLEDEGEAGAGLEEMEGLCVTLKKYLMARRARDNWRADKYETLVECEVSRCVGEEVEWCGGGAVFWLGRGRLWVGSTPRQVLTLPLVPPPIRETTSVVISPGELLLAVNSSNLTYLYDRTSVKEDFRLVLVLSFNARLRTSFIPELGVPPEEMLEEGPDDERLGWQRLMSMHPLPADENDYDWKSFHEFVESHRIRGCNIICKLFSGFGNLPESDRRLCLWDKNNMDLLMWDIPRRRVAAFLNMDCRIDKVQQGWDKRGFCVTLADGRIICYDPEGDCLDLFSIGPDEELLDSIIMDDVSAVMGAVVETGDRERVDVVMWSRGGSQGAVVVIRLELSCTGGSGGGARYVLNRAYLTASHTLLTVRLRNNSAVYVLAPTYTVHIPQRASSWRLLGAFTHLPVIKDVHIIQFIDGYALVLVGHLKQSRKLYSVCRVEPHGREVSCNSKEYPSLTNDQVVYTDTNRIIYTTTQGKFLVRQYA